MDEKTVGVRGQKVLTDYSLAASLVQDKIDPGGWVGGWVYE